MIDTNIPINISNLKAISDKVPSEDFINAQFDIDYEVETTDLLLILSTPRAGSTLLADYIYKNQLCLAHEYFQPFDYLPMLANRWNCIKENKLDKNNYLEKLLRFRTLSNGWLGINLHGNHLKVYSKFENLLSHVNKHYIHIVRRDLMSQAVSYELASQTGQWSSYFDSCSDAVYSYSGIENKLERILRQTALINAYIHTHARSCKTIYYEDLVENAEVILKSIIPSCICGNILVESEFEKQSRRINADWSERFSYEYCDSVLKDYDSETNKSFIHLIKKKLSRLIVQN